MEKNQDISSLLSDLLHHYDCVIVPELGGFVTDYRSARIDKELNIIHPPSKDLRFNAQLKKNDGLLANALSKAKEISHEEANARIKEEVDAYFSTLDGGKTVRFEKVGVLYLDSHKNMQFRADDSVNYLLESFRLKKVYARAVEEVVPAEVPIPILELDSKLETKPILPEIIKVEADTPPIIVKPNQVEEAERTIPLPQNDEPPIPVVPISEPSSGRRWMAAALIPLLFYLGFVAVRSDVVNDGNIQISDLNPFKKVGNTQSYSPRSVQFELHIESLPDVEIESHIPKVDIEEAPDWDKIKAELDAASSEKVVVEMELIPAEAINTYVAPLEIASMEFHVIGGCFGDLNNAERQVARLRKKGFDAFIMDLHKGLHRVTYGNYSSRAKALEDLKAIKATEQSDAWLLRKK